MSYAQKAPKSIDQNKNQLQVLEQVPIYKGCERFKTNEKLKKCFSKKLTKLIYKNFNIDVAIDAGISKGKYAILTIFKVNKEGIIVNIKAKSDYIVLEQEAIRVLNLVPKFKPGMQFGSPVTVPYSIPIYVTVFKEKKVKKKRRKTD